MARYVAMRFVDAVPTVLLVLTLVFVTMRLLPGDPAIAVLGQYATAEQLAQFRARMGLDAPIWQQYISFVLNALQLEFGRSLVNNLPIGELLRTSLPYTIELTIVATLMGIAIGIPLGVVSATHRGQAVDYGSRVFALTGFAVPDFYLGALLDRKSVV